MKGLFHGAGSGQGSSSLQSATAPDETVGGAPGAASTGAFTWFIARVRALRPGLWVSWGSARPRWIPNMLSPSPRQILPALAGPPSQ